jgi:methyl-accepting chemotaxis protein
MNFNNFLINFKDNLIAQTLYATKTVQDLAEKFEELRFESGLPTASMVIQQVFQGLMSLETGFALLALLNHRLEWQKKQAEDIQKRNLIRQVTSLKQQLLDVERQILYSATDLDSKDLMVSLNLKNACIASLQRQLALQKTASNSQATADNSQETADNSQETADNSQETADNSQETADNSQETAYKRLKSAYVSLQQQLDSSQATMMDVLEKLKNSM